MLARKSSVDTPTYTRRKMSADTTQLNSSTSSAMCSCLLLIRCCTAYYAYRFMEGKRIMTEIVGLQKAAGIAKVSRMTMSDWCNRLDLAEFRAGKWRIDP